MITIKAINDVIITKIDISTISEIANTDTRNIDPYRLLIQYQCMTNNIQ